jgi:hypothetical protein
VIYTRDDLRPTPTYPTYPPYHRGAYLEDYFYNKFIKDNPEVNRDYIAISWTTLYCENKDKNIQSFLDSLDQSKQYFTVLQHDDAPRHILPPDTLCFSAGGNVSGKNIIPIPLICSQLPKQLIIKEEEKKYIASFVGSATHPIRIKMGEALFGKDDYQIWIKQWSPSVNKSEFELFLELASKSKYLLCPRGYGLNSFRLYEAFQLGCVPVIITDKPYLPWQDELNWNEFSVLIDYSNILNIDLILKNIKDHTYHSMLEKGKKIYNTHFTLDGVYDNIIKKLK